jgi:hypothetical protein
VLDKLGIVVSDTVDFFSALRRLRRALSISSGLLDILRTLIQRIGHLRIHNGSGVGDDSVNYGIQPGLGLFTRVLMSLLTVLFQKLTDTQPSLTSYLHCYPSIQSKSGDD